MFKELIYELLWKSLEIVFAVVIGYFIFVLLEDTFATLWAIVGNTIIFYFFTPKIKPYIDGARKWVYKKLVGKKDEKTV